MVPNFIEEALRKEDVALQALMSFLDAELKLVEKRELQFKEHFKSKYDHPRNNNV